jgi:hypothetical protein
MPWKEFARNWRWNLTSTYRASFLGVERHNGFVVLELLGSAQAGEELRLDLECGNRLTGRPDWQRIVDEDRTRIGFFVDELGLSAADLEGLPGAPGSRALPRFEQRLWARLLPAQEQGALTANLSLGGCCLGLELPELIGQERALRLELPFLPEPWDFRARVVWSKEGRTGLQFLNLTLEQEQLLLRAVGQPLPTPSAFLPEREERVETNAFKIIDEGEATILLLSVPNWDYAFKFEHATVEGDREGRFDRFYTLESSEDLLRLKTRLGVCLKRQRNLIHVYLLDGSGELVTEIWGDEVWHDRLRRESQSAPSD